MGHKLGEIIRIVGITYYSLSPYEQKTFAGFFNPGFKKAARIVRDNFFFWAFPTISLYLCITCSKEYNRKLKRKNPADYANDV